ncbi:MAG: hypothetical protein U5L06_08080 [Rhodovibrio sp.]|nr:hypothetical protein [Rhodovibrio sp.]
MSYDAPVAPCLFDLLARSWNLQGAVDALSFNRDGSAVGYAAGQFLGIAPVDDPEGPEKRIRVAADSGRQSITPRESPVAPAVEVRGLRGALAPFGDRAFVTGSETGGLVSVMPHGLTIQLAVPFDEIPVVLVADRATATVAAAAGAHLVVFPEQDPSAAWQIDTGAVITALAFAPRGTELAAAHPGGVSLYRDGAFFETFELDGTPETLSYSPDGAFLACGMQEPGFAIIRLADGEIDRVRDYPTQVRSLIWSGPGRAFATSGAFRTTVWTFTAEGRGEPLLAGRTGLVIVDRVAAAPNRPLIAAGYASGFLCLSPIGGREEMFLRAEGGAITALAWSATGSHLAFGDASGEAALISLPANLFK